MRCVRRPGVIVGVLLWLAGVARAQVTITEVMVNPSGADGLWEWVEILNTSAAGVDLNGWIFQDDDGAHIVLPNTSNIQSTGGNTTVVPAGGVAVLYPGDALDFTPERFRAAWGQGITLIGVNSFGNGMANDDDAIGLWSSHADYMADALPGTMSPRRTFAHAVTSINYDVVNGYPPIASGRSIAWNGTGVATTAANWVSSANGALGAHVSLQTTLPGAAINDVADRGTPGVVPAGGAASGLLITEVMYDPASPEPEWGTVLRLRLCSCGKCPNIKGLGVIDEKLLALCADRANLSHEEVLLALHDPRWGEAGQLYDWRNHISDDIRRLWPQLSGESKLVAFFSAVTAAYDEGA